jgi:hypothetical protein
LCRGCAVAAPCAPRGHQFPIGVIDVVGIRRRRARAGGDTAQPPNPGAGDGPGCPVQPQHRAPLGRLDGAEADRESVQPKFDVLGDALGWSAEGLSEAEKIAVEVQSSFDLAGVEIDRAGQRANCWLRTTRADAPSWRARAPLRAATNQSARHPPTRPSAGYRATELPLIAAEGEGLAPTMPRAALVA